VDVARVTDMGAAAGDASHDADRAALRAVVDPAWRKLDDAVTALGDSADDAALHRVRRRAKRARYAAEAVEPVFGKPARDFARGMADLQTVLGEHQDAVIAGRWLRDTAARGVDERAAFAAGELAAAERLTEATTRDAFPAVWRDASRKSRRRWL